ncbi:hypothetical protein [Aulosira sp. FACHB-615]|uniref:hypothetical protein n=1 Tax=Aulosira sp. FACHB-615 TaxID=2692777 RepID=UPI00168329FF|nr:hypothetical protein [Aulosira sp. FACHB-615]MBD2490528.1 hypothetical protein [Aulosira sp. FACHB-615]
MIEALINYLGNGNPQLFRELKGRLKPRNILLTSALSLLGQFILFISFQAQLPTRYDAVQNLTNRYCTGTTKYDLPGCLADGFGNAIINWQLWSWDVFTWLNIIVSFGLLAAGSYLLINDLATEQRRDTLNFIRLSPQSPQSILLGKMLGVPALLYVAVVLALPLHFWMGLNAKIHVMEIISFDAVVIGASFLYYSAALIFGLVGSWLGGFQPWLGSGALLGYLIFTKQTFTSNFPTNNPVNFFGLLNPYFLMPYFDIEIDRKFSFAIPNFKSFSWFIFSIGESFITTAVFAVAVYFIGAYFFWQSLQRCFRDPNVTMLSKKQSYLLTAVFNLIILGCADWRELIFDGPSRSYSYVLQENIGLLMILNLGLFLYLIAAIIPGRQTLQDWARYRHITQPKELGKTSLTDDLIWGEKSPGILAIAINAIMSVTCLSCFALISQVSIEDKMNTWMALLFAGSLAVIYAALTQLILFMKNEQRQLWAAGVLMSVIILPPIFLGIFFNRPDNYPVVWLFSIAAPLIALSSSRSGDGLPLAYFLAILGHFAIATFLISQLTRKLKKAGESATKALLAGTESAIS